MTTSKTSELLKLFDAVTKDKEGLERALYHLLKDNEAKLPELDGDFHKAFRQIDVTGSAHTDMAIFELLIDSKLFWPCFYQIITKLN